MHTLLSLRAFGAPILPCVCAQFDTDLTIEQYLDKSYYKTATLIASSCRASAIFSGVDANVKHAMFEYGRHLGLAFQVSAGGVLCKFGVLSKLGARATLSGL